MYYGQSSIDAEGFRSLREGEVVEFFVETGEDGRMKAVKVTGPDGAPPQARPRAARLAASAASAPLPSAPACGWCRLPSMPAWCHGRI